jgi:hypothetical protein
MGTKNESLEKVVFRKIIEDYALAMFALIFMLGILLLTGCVRL